MYCQRAKAQLESPKHKLWLAVPPKGRKRIVTVLPQLMILAGHWIFHRLVQTQFAWRLGFIVPRPPVFLWLPCKGHQAPSSCPAPHLAMGQKEKPNGDHRFCSIFPSTNSVPSHHSNPCTRTSKGQDSGHFASSSRHRFLTQSHLLPPPPAVTSQHFKFLVSECFFCRRKTKNTPERKQLSKQSTPTSSPASGKEKRNWNFFALLCESLSRWRWLQKSTNPNETFLLLLFYQFPSTSFTKGLPMVSWAYPTVCAPLSTQDLVVSFIFCITSSVLLLQEPTVLPRPPQDQWG